MNILVVFGLLWACVSAEVMVHLFEWRYDDIAKECEEFLGPYGYDAIQISPVTENIIVNKKHPWYERYQPVSYILKTRSGDGDDLRTMVAICKEHGIKIYVDIIMNHMAAKHDVDTPTSGDSKPNTATKEYPGVPYGPEHFHETCSLDDFNNRTQVRDCELLGLQDLNQTVPYVRTKLVGLMNELVNKGVAGFRIDAAKHMDPADLREMIEDVNDLNSTLFDAGSRPYFYSESTFNVQRPQDDVIKPSEYFEIGGALDFKYGWEVSRAFERRNDLHHYSNFGEEWSILPMDKSVVFIDNHDTQRDGYGPPEDDSDTKVNLNYKNAKKYKMAVAFMLGWKHDRAQIMSSYDFTEKSQGPELDEKGNLAHVNVDSTTLACIHPRICEHRWRQIYNMVRFAKVVEDVPIVEWWSNGKNKIAFARQGKGFLAFNNEDTDFVEDLQTTLPPGIYCNLAVGLKKENICTGETVEVRSDGTAIIRIGAQDSDGFLAIHVSASLK